MKTVTLGTALLSLNGKWAMSLLTLNKNHIFCWDKETPLEPTEELIIKYKDHIFYDVTRYIGAEFPCGDKIRKYAKEACELGLKEIIVGWQMTDEDEISVKE